MTREIKIDTEKDVKRRVKQLLDKHKWFWWMPAANGFGTIGVADFNALRGAVFLAIETKFGSNKCTEHQKAFLRSISVEKGVSLVVTDKTLPQFERWLILFDKSMELFKEKKILDQDDGGEFLDCVKALTDPFI